MITQRRGAYTPDIRFAATTPLGTYYVEDQGAGHLGAYFLPKRKGSRPQTVGSANTLRGAYERILDHQDKALHPDAPRVTGHGGSVSIWQVGSRIGAREASQLEDEIQKLLAEA